MSDQEYINLSDLKVNYIDDHHDEENLGQPAYQIQPQPNTDKAIIIEVGKLAEQTDILINQFNISSNEKCIITSSIYHLNDLKELESDCKFPLIKIYVNYNNQKKLIPIGCMILFFHTYVHIKEKKGIDEYLSTKDNKKLLSGFYSISFHFDNKKIIMENTKEISTIMVMIDKMIEYLASQKIRDVIQDLIKKI